MTDLALLSAEDVHARLRARQITLIDIREPDEYAREHIDGAVSLPLSKLEQGALTLDAKGDLVFHCKSGMRTSSNCARLAAHVEGQGYMLDGGLEAWKRAGFSLAMDAKAPLELNRQVQIAAGLLILAGVTLGFLLHPAFFALSAFVGAGLTFAGVSGWCGMAHVLARAPWNRARA